MRGRASRKSSYNMGKLEKGFPKWLATFVLSLRGWLTKIWDRRQKECGEAKFIRHIFSINEISYFLHPRTALHKLPLWGGPKKAATSSSTVSVSSLGNDGSWVYVQDAIQWSISVYTELAIAHCPLSHSAPLRVPFPTSEAQSLPQQTAIFFTVLL